MTYWVNLEKFSGPLDLLISFIEEKKLDINEISLAQVTDQFLEYLKKIENNVSNEYQRILADFLVIASRLILIKSRSLLPSLVLTQEEEEDIKELEERLKNYQQFRALGRELGHFANGRVAYFSREYFLNLPTVFYPPQNISSEKLLKIYEAFIKTLPQVERPEEQSLTRTVTIEEKLKELTERINVAVEVSFIEISGSVKEKIDIVLAFLAMLMLMRSRIITASQDRLFGEIKVKKIINNV